MEKICIGSYKLRDDGIDSLAIPEGAIAYKIEGGRIKFYSKYEGDGNKRREIHEIQPQYTKILVKSRNNNNFIERTKFLR